MLKLLSVFCLLVSTSVWAQENEEDLLAPVVQEETLVEENEPQVELPECTDKALIEKTQEVLISYNDSHPIGSLYEKRKRALQMRLMKSFEEVSSEGFTSKQNRLVADKLLMTKINKGLEDSQIRLCRSQKTDERFKTVYLMMYIGTTNLPEIYVLNYSDNKDEEIRFNLVPEK